jgi:hypothetical protein
LLDHLCGSLLAIAENAFVSVTALIATSAGEDSRKIGLIAAIPTKPRTGE